MPKATVEDEKLVLLPKDVPLPAELLSVTVKSTPAGVGQKSGKPYEAFDNWKWEFRITDGEFAGLRVWAETDARISTHPNNKPRQFAEALLAAEFEIGMDFDTDDVVGLPCEVVLGHREYTSREQEERVQSFVAQLFPAGTTPNITGEPGF